MMQAYEISTKCVRCDILLAGRDQFMGHIMHGHDVSFEQADAMWKSIAMHLNRTSVREL